MLSSAIRRRRRRPVSGRTPMVRGRSPGGAGPAGRREARARLGLLGGTFDPPHVGHVATAAIVRHALALDARVIGRGPPTVAEGGAAADHPRPDRLAMVEAAVDERRRRGRQQRSRSTGAAPSYTADTLAAAARRGSRRGSCSSCWGPTPPPACSPGSGPTRCAGGRRWCWWTGPGTPAPPRRTVGRCVRVAVPRLDVSSTDLRRRVAAGRADRRAGTTCCPRGHRPAWPLSWGPSMNPCGRPAVWW